MTAANVLICDNLEFLKKKTKQNKPQNNQPDSLALSHIINRVRTVTIEAWGGNILEFNSLEEEAKEV